MAKMSAGSQIGVSFLEYVAGDVLSSSGTRLNLGTLGNDFFGNSPGVGYPPRNFPKIEVVSPDGAVTQVNQNIHATWTARQNAAGPYVDWEDELKPDGADHIRIYKSA